MPTHAIFVIEIKRTKKKKVHEHNFRLHQEPPSKQNLKHPKLLEKKSVQDQLLFDAACLPHPWIWLNVQPRCLVQSPRDFQSPLKRSKNASKSAFNVAFRDSPFPTSGIYASKTFENHNNHAALSKTRKWPKLIPPHARFVIETHTLDE